MTTQQAQDVVKAVFPDAFVANIDYGFGIFESKDKLEKWEALGLSKFDNCSIEAAWLSAASQITGKTIQP